MGKPACLIQPEAFSVLARHPPPPAGKHQAPSRAPGGLQLLDDAIVIEPSLPPTWTKVRFRRILNGSWYSIIVTKKKVKLTLEIAEVRLGVEFDPHPGETQDLLQTKKLQNHQLPPPPTPAPSLGLKGDFETPPSPSLSFPFKSGGTPRNAPWRRSVRGRTVGPVNTATREEKLTFGGFVPLRQNLFR